MNKYAKAIISVLTSAETVFSLYPHVHWSQAVAAGIGSFLVWFVPNTKSADAGPKDQEIIK